MSFLHSVFNRKPNIEMLVKSGNIKRLVSALGYDDAGVQREAASALAGIGGESSVDHLIEALQNSDEDMRNIVVRILGKIKDERAVGPIVYALTNGSITEHNATAALVGIGRPAIQSLIDVYFTDDKSIKRVAATILARLKWEPTEGKDKVNFFILAKQFSKLSEYSTLALEPLIASLEETKHPEAIKTLGSMNDNRAVSPLIKLVFDDNYRQQAIFALIELGHLAIHSLTEITIGPEWAVREAAINALGKIQDKGQIIPLIKALNDRDSYVREAAIQMLIEAFTEYREYHIIEPIVAIAQEDADTTIKEFAIDAIIRLKPLVSSRMEDCNQSDKAATKTIASINKIILASEERQKKEELAKVHQEQIAQATKKLLCAGSEMDREAPAAFLRGLGVATAVEPLMLALRSSDEDVRYHAAWALEPVNNSV